MRPRVSRSSAKTSKRCWTPSISLARSIWSVTRWELWLRYNSSSTTPQLSRPWLWLHRLRCTESAARKVTMARQTTSTSLAVVLAVSRRRLSRRFEPKTVQPLHRLLLEAFFGPSSFPQTSNSTPRSRRRWLTMRSKRHSAMTTPLAIRHSRRTGPISPREPGGSVTLFPASITLELLLHS